MKKELSVLAISMCLLLPISLVGSPPSVVGFGMWKAKKTDEAKSVVADMARKLRGSQNSGSPMDLEGESRETLARKLSQAQFNLALTKELSANDYVILYLIPQNITDRQALVTAAKSLRPGEMAEIIQAYQRIMATPKTTELSEI